MQLSTSALAPTMPHFALLAFKEMFIQGARSPLVEWASSFQVQLATSENRAQAERGFRGSIGETMQTLIARHFR